MEYMDKQFSTGLKHRAQNPAAPDCRHRGLLRLCRRLGGMDAEAGLAECYLSFTSLP
jgi:hypothetical protein